MRVSRNPYSISTTPLKTARIARLRLSAAMPAPGTMSTLAPAKIPSIDRIAGTHRTLTRSPKGGRHKERQDSVCSGVSPDDHHHRGQGGVGPDQDHHADRDAEYAASE